MAVGGARAQPTPDPVFEAETIGDVAIGYGLQVGDVDGDGRLDVIASGRDTHDAIIFWNRTDL